MVVVVVCLPFHPGSNWQKQQQQQQQVLFNERGTVAAPFRDHTLELMPYRDYLAGDRTAWGALLTSIFNQWSRSPADFRESARAHLR